MRPFKLDIEEIIEIARPSRKEGQALDQIAGFASLETARPGDLSFFDVPTYVAVNPIYEKQLAECRASVILVPEKMELKAKHGQLLLFVAKPTFALALICRKIEQQLFPKPSAGIHPSAVIDREADVHPDAHVGPLCYVGHHARIHAGTILHGGCTVRPYAEIGAASELKSGVRIMDDCVIGKRCVLHSGVVIGSDGFGFATVEGEHIKIPQIGNVVVEDDVEIGANTTIDRARFGITRIGHGTKIDNLVQIGHNVTIGKGCFIVAQTGISGSATLGDYVVLGGQSGVAGHVKIGSYSQAGGQAGVNHDWPEKSIVNGTPAMELQKCYRVEALKRRLPDLFKRVSALEDKVK